MSTDTLDVMQQALEEHGLTAGDSVVLRYRNVSINAEVTHNAQILSTSEASAMVQLRDGRTFDIVGGIVRTLENERTPIVGMLESLEPRDTSLEPEVLGGEA